jgi:hypothetical protein
MKLVVCSIRTAIITTILFFGVVFPSYAELVCNVQSFKGSKIGIVTRPGKSGEFHSLMNNNMKDEAIRCCVACLVTTGTKVIITSHGFMSHTIRVLEGEYRGCVGDLPAEYVGNCQ